MYMCIGTHPSAFARNLLSERGTALMELAIVTPFVIAVMFATIELSFSIKNHASMVEAARVAARAAAILPPDTDSGGVHGAVVGALTTSLQHSGIALADVAINVDTPVIASSLLSVSLARFASLLGAGDSLLATSGGAAPVSAIPAVRYIRVRLESRPRNFFSRLAAAFTPRTVVSAFPLAANNRVLSSGAVR